jgi:CHASE2 domain-containing sensor protein
VGRIGDPLTRFSYDLPFLFRPKMERRQSVVLAFVDDSTLLKLGQSGPGILDRNQHVRFLRRLTEARAKAVLYDFLFPSPDKDPNVDNQFAAAMRQQGHVVLAEAIDMQRFSQGLTTKIISPLPLFRTNGAQACGLTDFWPLDPGNTVRQITTVVEGSTSAVWQLAGILKAPVAQRARSIGSEKWLNYYGPPNSGIIPACDLEQALASDGLPPDFFRDKIVLVGGRTTAGPINSQRDTFGTPYTRFGSQDAAGVEIHATALLNLLDEQWIERPRGLVRLGGVWGFGIFITLLLAGQPGRWRAPLALISMLLLTALSFSMQWHLRIWWPWSIPVFVQAPLALAWSLARPKPRATPVAFISYRRDGGAETARAIRTALAERGMNAFLDVDDMGPGRYGDQILQEIERRPSFILLLSPGALDRCSDERDALRQEIAHAIQTKRNIIPVNKNGFVFPKKDCLPEAIAPLAEFQAINYSELHFEATIHQLVEFLERRGPSHRGAELRQKFCYPEGGEGKAK